MLKYLPNLKRLSFYGTQRRNAGVCWAPVMTDIELDTIALLAGLEELNIGDGVALGAPKPAALGPATGEAECRIAGGTRITDFGIAKLANLKKLRYLNLSGSVVTGGALKTLAALPNLQRLSLWNAEGINDASAAAFESLQSVTSLDLSNTGIGDRTLTALAKLPNLRAPLYQRHSGDGGGRRRIHTAAAVDCRVVGRAARAARAARGIDQTAWGLHRMSINARVPGSEFRVPVAFVAVAGGSLPHCSRAFERRRRGAGAGAVVSPTRCIRSSRKPTAGRATPMRASRRHAAAFPARSAPPRTKSRRSV